MEDGTVNLLIMAGAQVLTAGVYVFSQWLLQWRGIQASQKESRRIRIATYKSDRLDHIHRLVAALHRRYVTLLVRQRLPGAEGLNWRTDVSVKYSEMHGLALAIGNKELSRRILIPKFTFLGTPVEEIDITAAEIEIEQWSQQVYIQIHHLLEENATGGNIK